MAKAAMHGLSRSAITKVQGGHWSAGFWSGFASSAFAAKSSWGKTAGTMVTSVVSGTVSSIAGGKFANDAVTGAFVHLFNHVMDMVTKLTLYPHKSTEYNNTMLTVSRMDNISFRSGILGSILKPFGLKSLSSAMFGVSSAVTYYKHVSLASINKTDIAGLSLDISADMCMGKTMLRDIGSFGTQQIFNYTREKAIDDFSN